MPNDLKKLRRLMRTAHAIQKSNPVILRGAPISQSLALRFAWWFESFRLQLRKGIYRFTYLKSDGSIREATGTLNPELIPESDRPKTSPDTPAREPSPGIFTYYDLTRKAWRSFRCDNFIGFIEKV